MLRSLEYKGSRLEYIVKKESRRSFKIKIDKDSKLILHVPNRAGYADMERVIIQKWNWIHKHLNHRNNIREVHPELPEPTFKDGCMHYFLGEAYPISLNKSRENSIRLEDSQWKLSFTQKHFPPDKELGNHIFSMWYKSQSEILFPELVNSLKKDFGPGSDENLIVKSRFMKARWGTCIVKGNQKTINLNTNLIQLPVSLIEYVIAHELSHLSHMNHSKSFYDFLEKRRPDWKQAKKETEIWLYKIRNYR